MCDPNTATGHVTFKDIQNSFYYARMKLTYEQFNKDENAKKNLDWVSTNSDHSSSYTCPPNLTCYDGSLRINNKSKCNELGARGLSPYLKVYDDSKDGIKNIYNVKPDAKNGYFLEWRGSDETTGECYMANPYFYVQCKENNFDNHEKSSKKDVGGLKWDQGRCLITKEYCNNAGFNDIAYEPGNLPNGDGGTCNLSGWGSVSDYIFGETITRGLFNGANSC